MFWSRQWGEVVLKAVLGVSVFGSLLLFGLDETSSRDGAVLNPQSFGLRPPAAIEQEWTITKGTRAPDGVEKEVYLINGQFPGPLVEARSGDTLKIRVVNELRDQGTAIHWHGLYMRDANRMDGAVGITQDPIPPSASMVYEFRIDDAQCGTFWYHAHSELQRADGLYGPLVVHCPSAGGGSGSGSDSDSDDRREERILMVGDWYHQEANRTLQWYRRPAVAPNEPVPDSLLVNGLGAFNCSKAVPARPVVCSEAAAPSISLDRDKELLFRIINVGSLSGFSLSISGAKLRATHVDDGSSIQPVSAESVGVLYPGERLDVVVEWDGCPSESSLEIELDDENYRYRNPTLTAKQSFPISFKTLSRCSGTYSSASEEEARSETSHFDLQTALSLDRLPMSRGKADATVVVYSNTMQLQHRGNRPEGFMNQTSWSPQSPPLIDVPRDEWDQNQFVPFLEGSASRETEPMWVDIVINNVDDGGHPFHLHGHDFWVLHTYQAKENWGSWNPFKTDLLDAPGGAFEMEFPRKKDTVFVPRFGYAVLRLRADNPGLWMLHCHIIWHQATGMVMALEIEGS